MPKDPHPLSHPDPQSLHVGVTGGLAVHVESKDLEMGSRLDVRTIGILELTLRRICLGVGDAQHLGLRGVNDHPTSSGPTDYTTEHVLSLKVMLNLEGTPIPNLYQTAIHVNFATNHSVVNIFKFFWLLFLPS